MSSPDGGRSVFGFLAAVIDDARCDTCNNHAPVAGGLMNATTGDVVCVCRWCLATLLSEVTGFGFVNQLLSWETLRNSKRPTPWKGWQRVQVGQDLDPSREVPQD